MGGEHPSVVMYTNGRGITSGKEAEKGQNSKAVEEAEEEIA